MKILYSLVLVTSLLLLAETIVPAQAGWGWGSSKDDEEKKPDLKTNELRDEGGFSSDPDNEAALDKEALEDLPASELDGASTYGEEERPEKFLIPEDENLSPNIKTISSLPDQGAQQEQPDPYPGYDRTPVQSEFVVPGAHPTESREADPRFAARQPRQCASEQYLCAKATPSQEHVRCIPNQWKCNGVRDCELNDDEEGCAVNAHRQAPNSCNEAYQYTCYGTGINGIPAQCVDQSKVCDGTYDCTYGDDEAQERCESRRSRDPPTAAAHAPAQDTRVRPESSAPPAHAPPVYSTYPVQASPAPAPAVQQMAPQSCNGGRGEEYIKRLEWTDRCIRTCMSRSPNAYK